MGITSTRKIGVKEDRMKDKVVVATIKSWNSDQFKKLKTTMPNIEWILIRGKEDFTVEALNKIKPEYIFFPHWSWPIQKEVYEKYECIVFHMTDLPFGRGGSPLQNLISRGIYKTKISAIKVWEGIDSGPIYLKKDLDLTEGNATNIFKKASNIIFEMIKEIIEKKPAPVVQKGKIITFNRRTPEQSEIPKDASLQKMYDWIRMLDGEGYPTAFIQTPTFRLELADAIYKNGELTAKVRLRRKNR